MSLKLIERAWASYSKGVVPADAGPTQIAETRQAFYAGASILFSILTGVGLSEGDEPQESDLELLQAVQDEVDTFGAELDAKVLKTIKRH